MGSRKTASRQSRVSVGAAAGERRVIFFKGPGSFAAELVVALRIAELVGLAVLAELVGGESASQQAGCAELCPPVTGQNVLENDH